MTQSEVDQLAASLVDHTEGKTRVVAATGDLIVHEDGPCAHIYLTLNRPRGDTWPVEDVLELRRILARKSSIPVHLRLAPK